MESNIGGVINTMLSKASEYTTINKNTGIRPFPHQAAEEALRYQSRDTATKI